MIKKKIFIAAWFSFFIYAAPAISADEKAAPAISADEKAAPAPAFFSDEQNNKTGKLLVIGSVGEGYEKPTGSGIAPEDVYTLETQDNCRHNLPNNHIQQSILDDIPVQRQFQNVFLAGESMYMGLPKESLPDYIPTLKRSPDYIPTLNKTKENHEKTLNHSLKLLLAGGRLIINPLVYTVKESEFKSKDTMYGFFKIVDETEMDFLSKYLLNGLDESAMTEEIKHLKDNLGRSDTAVANSMEACNIIIELFPNGKDYLCTKVGNALKDHDTELAEGFIKGFIELHSQLMQLIQYRYLLKDKDNLEGGSITYGKNPHNNREGFYFTIRKKSENA